MLREVVAVIIGIVLPLSTAAARAPHPLRASAGEVFIRFGENLHISRDLRFTGATSVRSIPFSLPPQWKPLPGSTLHLYIEHSPELDGDRSFLSISLNYGVVRSLRLDQQNQRVSEVIVPLAPAMIKDENELVFSVEQFSTANAPSGDVWSAITLHSFLDIRYEKEPVDLTLAHLPASLFADPYRPQRLAVVRPASIDPETLQAAALLIAGIASRTTTPVSVNVVRSIRAAGGDPVLLVGTPREQPQLISVQGKSPLAFYNSRGTTLVGLKDGTVLRKSEGAISLTGAGYQQNPLLIVTGNSPAAVLNAAETIFSANWNSSGSFVRVTKDAGRDAALKPHEWKGFIPPRNTFELADIGLKQIKITAQEDSPVLLNLDAPPDVRFLDYGHEMLLKVGLNAEALVPTAHLVVQVNNAVVGDYVVGETFKGTAGTLSVEIPAHVLRTRNVVKIVWKGPATSQGVVGWLSPDSELYLPRYYEAELPDLGLLQFHLYPFSVRADLSDVIFVVPNNVNEAMLSSLLELVARFAQLAPAEHFSFHVRRMAEVTKSEISGAHLVVLHAEDDGNPLPGVLSRFKPPMRSVKRQPLIQEVISPWNAQRYVLIISAESTAALRSAVANALSESNLARISGDAAYLAPETPVCFVLGPKQTIREYAYSSQLDAWLRVHWYSLPIILVLVSGLLFIGWRLTLQNRTAGMLRRPDAFERY